MFNNKLIPDTNMLGKDDIVPPGVKLRDFDDFTALRGDTFDAVANAFKGRFPQEYGKYRLELDNIHYPEKNDFDLDQQKSALMKNQFLGKRLRGNFKLFNKDSGDLIEEKEVTLMRVPYVTDRGTVIHNGNEYVTLNQARLSSGIYTRKKESGEIEAHINAKRGTGRSYKLRMEPKTSLYKLDIDQASLRLYSLLHDIGVSDDELELRWGPDIFAINKEKYDPRVLDKAYNKLVRDKIPDASKEEKANAVREALKVTKLSRSSVERTLPNLFNQKTASVWRKFGFQMAQTSDEFVKWDQKRQEMEAKAQQKEEQALAKRDLDTRRKQLEIRGLNADILNDDGKVDPHAVVKQVMQNMSNKQKTEKTIRTKKVTKELKHQNKQYIDKIKAEDKLQDRFHDIQDKAEQARIEQERENVLAQIRQSLPQQQVPQQPPLGELMPKLAAVMPQPTTTFNAADINPESDAQSYDRVQNLLAQTLYGEARGEGDEGMMNVGTVIANRVADKTGEFKNINNWEQAIMQPKQFSIWNDPNSKLYKDLKALKPNVGNAVYDNSYNLAGKLLGGERTSNPKLSNAMYYYNLKTLKNVAPSWASNVKNLGAHGRHTFHSAEPVTPPVTPTPVRNKSGSALSELLQAKQESDEKKYHHKQTRLRKLMIQHPEDFVITTKDSKGIYGITHNPTGFRMHLPKHVLADLPVPDKSESSVRDRAVELLGLNKPAASIESAELNLEAPNYGPAEEELKSCSQCIHRDEAGTCRAFNFKCAVDFTCDAWKEDTVKYAAKGKFEQAPGNKKNIHTNTLSNGHQVDVIKLKKIADEKTSENVQITELKLNGANRSRSTGFGSKRYENADTNIPVLVDSKNNIIDGRHRYFRLLDDGSETISVKRLSNNEIASCYTDNSYPDYDIKTKQ